MLLSKGDLGLGAQQADSFKPTPSAAASGLSDHERGQYEGETRQAAGAAGSLQGRV